MNESLRNIWSSKNSNDLFTCMRKRETKQGITSLLQQSDNDWLTQNLQLISRFHLLQQLFLVNYLLLILKKYIIWIKHLNENLWQTSQTCFRKTCNWGCESGFTVTSKSGRKILSRMFWKDVTIPISLYTLYSRGSWKKKIHNKN